MLRCGKTQNGILPRLNRNCIGFRIFCDSGTQYGSGLLQRMSVHTGHSEFKENIELTRMIRQNAPSKEIFQYISKNIPSQKVSPVLVEEFMVSLLKDENLSAVACLVHLSLGSHSGHRNQFSNQLWALLASSAISQCHHSTALLVYHEIVNPAEKYKTEDHTSSEENPHTPYLILPSAIQDLAVVFARHGNTAAIEGLRSYFQRYYSYLGHSETYKALQALIIESHAQNGDLENALDRFSDFAMKFRGHGRYKHSKVHEDALRSAVEKNSHNRQTTIGRPLASDKFSDGNSNPEFQNITYNKYTLLGQRFMAMFKGDLKVADLPIFYSLLDAKIQELAADGSSAFLDRLIFLITKSHHALGKFIIASLCHQGKSFEAIFILKKLQSKYHYAFSNPEYTLGSEFLAIFRSIRIRLDNCQGSVPSEERNLLQNAFQMYIKYGDDVLASSCYGAYIMALLSDSVVAGQEVTEHLENFRKLHQFTPIVDLESYKKAERLGIASDLFRLEE